MDQAGLLLGSRGNDLSYRVGKALHAFGNIGRLYNQTRGKTHHIGASHQHQYASFFCCSEEQARFTLPCVTEHRANQ